MCVPLGSRFFAFVMFLVARLLGCPAFVGFFSMLQVPVLLAQANAHMFRCTPGYPDNNVRATTTHMLRSSDRKWATLCKLEHPTHDLHLTPHLMLSSRTPMSEAPVA